MKKLPAPELHADLEGGVVNIKDMSGLESWNSFTLDKKVYKQVSSRKFISDFETILINGKIFPIFSWYCF